MSSIDYNHLTVSELKCLSMNRNVDVGGRKKDLIARLIYEDLNTCSMDVLKVLLKNRGLPTGGLKKDLQQRLAVACSSGGAILLPGALAAVAVSRPSTMVSKNHNKNKFLLDTAHGSSSGSQFEEAENGVFPGQGMEVVTKRVKREIETVSTSVSHRGSKLDGKVLLQEWEQMNFSPLAQATPTGVSNIKKTPISVQSIPGCLVTPMKKIVGSKHKNKMGAGMKVPEQGNGLGLEVVTKKVKRDTETVSHRGSKLDGKGLLQEWEKMSFSPLAQAVLTPIGKAVSNIKKTPISGRSMPGCLATPMKKIAGSKHKSKMGVGMNVREQVKALPELKTNNKPGPVARILVTPRKQTVRSKPMCEQEFQEQGMEECNGMVVKGQKKSVKKVMSRQIEVPNKRNGLHEVW